MISALRRSLCNYFDLGVTKEVTFKGVTEHECKEVVKPDKVVPEELRDKSLNYTKNTH